MYSLPSCALPSATITISCLKFPGLAVKTSQSGTSSVSIHPVSIHQCRPSLLMIFTHSSGDSLGASAQESINRYDEVASKHPSSILALNHETIASTSEQVVPYAIQRLQQAGYRLVTLAECLGQQPYQWVGEPQTRDVCPIPCSLSFGITPSFAVVELDMLKVYSANTPPHIGGLLTVCHELTTLRCDAWTSLRLGHYYLHFINFSRMCGQLLQHSCATCRTAQTHRNGPY